MSDGLTPVRFFHSTFRQPRLRHRSLYALAILVTAACGLASRKLSHGLPPLLAKEPGDALWALEVFLLLGFLFPRIPTPRAGLLALAISYVDEVSQLYHAPWIESIRRTTVGGLILGYGFRWADLVAYTVGVAIGMVAETATGDRKPRDGSFRA